MNRRHTTQAKEAREKEYEEDARRLREFAAFAKFSDDDLKRIARATHRTATSGPWPLIREQTPSDALLHPAQRRGRGVRRPRPHCRGGAG